MEKAEDFRIVFVSIDGSPKQRQIARHLIEKKLAACVSIFPNIESIYEWEGKIENSNESIMMIKTHESKLEAIENEIKLLHNYETPEIISININESSLNYLNWMKEILKI